MEWLSGAVWLTVGGSIAIFSAWIAHIEDVFVLFWLGTVVNVLLAIAKMGLAQVATHQKALMADAVHGLGDTVAEVITALAYTEAARPPDREHPWGHGKIESIGAVIVTCMLLYIAASIGWDSLVCVVPMVVRRVRRWRSGGQAVDPVPAPDPAAAEPAGASTCKAQRASLLARRAAIAVTFASVLLKEALFTATLSVAESAQSNLVLATAWHHRSDSLAAGVTLASQLGTLLGQNYLDSLGGSIVASMLAHSAYGSLCDSLNDLLDYNPASETETSARCGHESLSQSITGVQGVRNHKLRTRRMGPYCLVDATIVVDARISASAASMIAEAVHDRVIQDFRPFVTDVVVHVDPDGSPQSHHIDTQAEEEPLGQSVVSPEEVEAQVRAAVLALAEERPELPRIVEVTELQSYYYVQDQGLPAAGSRKAGRGAPYVDVKVDFRLASTDVTIRAATAVARAARERVLAALPGVVREIDVDLELVEGGERQDCRSGSAAAWAVTPGGGGGCERSSWATDPCPAAAAASAMAALSARSLQQVTLIWERGPESRQARVPKLRHEHRITWTPLHGWPKRPWPGNLSRRSLTLPNEPD